MCYSVLHGALVKEIVECATGCSAALLPDWTRPLPCQQGPKSTGPAPVYHPVDIILTAVKANTSLCYKIVLDWEVYVDSVS